MAEIANSGLKPEFKFEDPSKPPEQNIIPIPPTEPTPTPTPTPIPAPTPDPTQVNEEEILKNILGEGHSYKSFEEVKALKIGERLSDLQRLSQEHVKVKSEVDKYKGRVALMESPQFLSATKYSHFVKDAGMEVDYGTFQKLEKFDPKEMKDDEAIILLDYLKNGEKGRTREELNAQYKLGDYAPEIEDAEGNKVKKENEFDRRNLEREAVGARKELSQFKEKIANFKPEFQDNSAEKVARQEEWKKANAVDTMASFFKTLDPPVSEIKGIKVDAAYQFTPEDQGEIKKLIQQEIEFRDIPLTQESVETVYGSVMNTMRVRKMPEMMKLFGEKLIANVDMALKARYSYYQGLDTPPDRKQPIEQKRPDGSMTADELAKDMMSKRNR